MYGQIHVVFREMVLEKYGSDLWTRVLAQAGLDTEQDFLQFVNYPEESFCRMIMAITECTDEAMEEVLEEFGDFFIKYVLMFGYDKMLRTLGGDIVTFVQNLDSLHSLLSLTYTGISPPSFRCEHTATGGLLLHYYSCRSGLYPLVVGLIQAVGREIFGHKVELTRVRTKKDDLGEGKSQEHTVFNVHFPDLPTSPSASLAKPHSSTAKKSQCPPLNNAMPHSVPDSQPQLTLRDNVANQALPSCAARQSHCHASWNGEADMTVVSSTGTNPGICANCSQNMPPTCHNIKHAATAENNSIGEVGETLSGPRFCRTFPYHVFFDKQLTIIQCGDTLQRLLPPGVGPGSSMMAAFYIRHPCVEWSLDNLLRFTNSVFMLALRCEEADGAGGTRKALHVKGQMIWLEEEDRMMFIGSPRLKSLKEMEELNLHMADIPLFDATREIVLLYEQRNAEIGITQKLDQTTAELMRISKALETEKQKTDQLLHQMLPPKVAMQLKNGHIVEAETFQTATIMFSDVVTFTTIAAACPPERIVNMLNDMYERFDKATTLCDVYKVETIGDAYMVVGGVPERSDDHAQNVARFAVTIVGQAALVRSPATGLPLQIRVGIHTGPVMAGVVGIKMPRYCLFGDTVNTASRMESHGVPGRIHLSSQTFRCLKDFNFRFKRRGTVEIKGKGSMATYFLVSDSDITVAEPEDEFTSLPLIDDVIDRNLTPENGGDHNGPPSTDNGPSATDMTRTANIHSVNMQTDQSVLKTLNGPSRTDRQQAKKSRHLFSPRRVKPKNDSDGLLFCTRGVTTTPSGGNTTIGNSKLCTVL